VILGAAFGGLELSSRLSAELADLADLADKVDVTLGPERFVHLDNRAGAGRGCDQ